nr:unnamed protein product [Digitaria exilis]
MAERSGMGDGGMTVSVGLLPLLLLLGGIEWEVEAEEARMQSTTAGTASAGRARKELLRAATACSEGDAMAEADVAGARGERRGRGDN